MIAMLLLTCAVAFAGMADVPILVPVKVAVVKSLPMTEASREEAIRTLCMRAHLGGRNFAGIQCYLAYSDRHVDRQLTRSVPSATAKKPNSDAIALFRQIVACMSVPLGAVESGTTVQLELTIDPAGDVVDTPDVIGEPESTMQRALASALQRAALRCGPYSVARGGTIRVIFDPVKFQ